jgi:hypothetical protein
MKTLSCRFGKARAVNRAGRPGAQHDETPAGFPALSPSVRQFARGRSLAGKVEGVQLEKRQGKRNCA